MELLKVLLATTFIIGCGRETILEASKVKDVGRGDSELIGDPDLILEYKAEVFRQSKVLGMGYEGRVVEVKFVPAMPGNVPSTVIGLCNKASDEANSDFRTIFILEKLRSFKKVRLAVLAHEIGHCVYDQNHYDGTLDLMNTYMQSELYNNLESYRQKYLWRVSAQ